MNEENTKILVESFPDLYGKDFYFQCDDGWFNLVYGLSSAIDFFRRIYEDTLIESDADEYDMRRNEYEYDYLVFQCKEKFGGLRYYTQGRVDMFSQRLIEQYENCSVTVCESCGANGSKLRTISSIIKTLCEECNKKHQHLVAKR